MEISRDNRSFIEIGGIKMAIVVLIASIYTFLETVITGYLEYKNNNKPVGILLFIIAVFCLIVPNFIV